jgi:ATP-dependent DNA helicase RecQ
VAEKPRKKRVGEIECDEVLFERLRVLRRGIADERGVPAYIIFSDASLRQMAHKQPTSLDQFAAISGVGQQKLKSFGDTFVREITDYTSSRLSSA